MSDPAGLPFGQALDFWRGKVQLPTSGWTDIWQEQHSHAFVVAGAAQDALLEDFYNALRQAQEKGTGYPAFREQFAEIAKKHGWTHKGAPGWRSKVIYDTNIRQSWQAGRYQQMVAQKEFRPYWVYRHHSIEHPRLEHQAWDGLILPADDPWFDSHMPQNGWGCKCTVDSLTRTEASRAWEKAGKSGPDTAPEIEWEERTVGKQGSQPRVVQVAKGVDPGFAYNPGKAWLEPHTVPPLQGYDAVLQERGTAWPTSTPRPPLPQPTQVSQKLILPPATPPELAVTDFLEVFGADMARGAVFVDSANTPMAITRALFEDGNGDLKWLSKPDKASRIEYVNLLAMTLIEPDEIWWNWERSRDTGRWLLKRRYLRAFELAGSQEYGVVAFEWGRTGWSGSTAFLPDRKDPANRAAYFDRQRLGRLVFKK